MVSVHWQVVYTRLHCDWGVGMAVARLYLGVSEPWGDVSSDSIESVTPFTLATLAHERLV